MYESRQDVKAMENWLEASLKEAGMTPEELGIEHPEHPGRLTLNEVNEIARKMPPEHARRMLDRIVEVFAL